MDKTEIRVIENVKLSNPILIEGLPGLGFVGKIATDHLIRELGAKQFAELYSPDLPPQVMIQSDGTVRLMKNDLHAYKGKRGQPDLIFLTGDAQGFTIQSHYAISGSVLDFCKKHGTKRVYTLGGFGIGRVVKEPRVFGAVTSKGLIPELKKGGVVFNQVTGPIVGAAGLLLGLGQLRGMEGICLMGETHGNYADPKSARKVTEILAKLLHLDVSLKDLDKQAKETAELLSQFEQMQSATQQQQIAGGATQPVKPDEPLAYIR